MKKRVLLVIAGNNGTIGMCSRNLYLALCQQEDIEVKCVGVHHFDNGLPELEDIEYYRPEGNAVIRKIAPIAQSRWLAGIKKSFYPDITISTLFSTSLINVLAGGKDKKIGIFHSPHQQQKVNGLLSYAVTLFCYNFIYPRLDVLACVSEEVKEALNAFPLLNKNKVDVVYNVHFADKIRSMGEEMFPDSEKDILSCPYLLYCGRFDSNKAPIRALEAFASAGKPDNAKIVFIGGGDGVQQELLSNKARQLGIADNVCILGKKANPYMYMKNASALISSSYSEGLPGVMIESLVLGTPVITTNSSKGIWEIFSALGDYSRELDTMFKNDCGIITSNLSFRDPSRYEHDIKSLSVAISKVWDFGKVRQFKFEQKVSADYICKQITK